MGIKFVEVTVPERIVKYYKCDKCRIVIWPQEHAKVEDIFQGDFVGGYGSVFGDGEVVKGLLCGLCFKGMLEGYLP